MNYNAKKPLPEDPVADQYDHRPYPYFLEYQDHPGEYLHFEYDHPEYIDSDNEIKRVRNLADEVIKVADNPYLSVSRVCSRKGEPSLGPVHVHSPYSAGDDDLIVVTTQYVVRAGDVKRYIEEYSDLQRHRQSLVDMQESEIRSLEHEVEDAQRRLKEAQEERDRL